MKPFLGILLAVCLPGTEARAVPPQPANAQSSANGKENGKQTGRENGRDKANDNANVNGAEAAREERYRKFTDQMTAVKLVGRFTVIGRDDGPLAREEYTIHKVEKLPEGDKWLIHARIKYGMHDLTVPLPLDVKWAGRTPVITLDDLTIPGLGTFSSRVVIDDGKYAGTWRHDNHAGHLFGVIEKLTAAEKQGAGRD